MLTLKEAAEYMAGKLGRKTFSTETIRCWIAKGKLKSEKVGGKNFVKVEDLEFFLPENLRSNQVACGDRK